MAPRVLLVIPPLTQLNTPYPASANRFVLTAAVGSPFHLLESGHFLLHLSCRWLRCTGKERATDSEKGKPLEKVGRKAIGT